MAADHLPAALADLDPGSRALLDLSLRRGISPTEIGELLRKDPIQVERGVDDVLELLADALGVEGPDRRDQVREALSDLPGDAWQATPPSRDGRPKAPPAVPRPEPEAEPDVPYFTPKDRERRAAWPVILLILIISTLVLGSLLLFTGGSGDDKDEEPASPDARQGQPNQPAPAPDGDGEPRRVQLARVHSASSGSGRVILSGDGQRLDVSIKGMPPPKGAYEIWVYNSIVDAKSLGSFRDTKIKLDARLPDQLENYRYVDVSLEPVDGNPNHSGDSVLRAPVDDLLIGEQ